VRLRAHCFIFDRNGIFSTVWKPHPDAIYDANVVFKQHKSRQSEKMFADSLKKPTEAVNGVVTGSTVVYPSLESTGNAVRTLIVLLTSIRILNGCRECTK
jgi:uncharacterized protein (UPF0254 family)